MKILTLTRTEEQKKNDDYRDRFQLSIDGKIILDKWSGGEPEDNTFGRDLNFIFSITKWLKQVAEAKDPVEFEQRNFTDEENDDY